ncbi:MAG: hypothetical protein ABS894_00810 [Aerococcus urinaeequi]
MGKLDQADKVVVTEFLIHTYTRHPQTGFWFYEDGSPLSDGGRQLARFLELHEQDGHLVEYFADGEKIVDEAKEDYEPPMKCRCGGNDCFGCRPDKYL